MIVVFGGSGFIGGALVDLLREQGRPVEVVSHRLENVGRPGYRFADLERPETIHAAVEGAEVVVQSTTFPGYPFEKVRQGMTFMRYDGIGTERIVAAAKAGGVKRYVYVSGVGTRADSDKPYFQAIYRAETAVRTSGLEWASLRPAFVYGPRDAGLNKLLKIARYARVLPLIGLDSTHQPVYVGDVARALARLTELGAPQGVFEIGGPERMTMREMLEHTLSRAGQQVYMVPVPKMLASIGGKVLKRLPGELLSDTAVDFICEDFVADNTRVLEAAPMELTRFADGIKRQLPEAA